MIRFNINDALRVTVGDDFVAVIELAKPPNNFSPWTHRGVAQALEHLDTDDRCRSVVLCAERLFLRRRRFLDCDTHFTTEDLYAAAVESSARKSQLSLRSGAAIGGGLGCFPPIFELRHLKLGSLRTCPSRFSSRVRSASPFPPGRSQAAAELLYTGRRIGGEEAVLGMADRLSSLDDLRSSAHSLRAKSPSPHLAVQSFARLCEGPSR